MISTLDFIRRTFRMVLGIGFAIHSVYAIETNTCDHWYIIEAVSVFLYYVIEDTLLQTSRHK